MKCARPLVLTTLVATAAALACTTDDVTTQPPDSRNLFPLPDAAFAEYLIFRGVPGVVVNEADAATAYSLDVDVVGEVTELSLSKTNSAIADLQMAGVATADTRITSLAGLEHFLSLETLRITSNDVASIDLSRLTRLRNLEMNFNEVGSLNLSGNVALELLRYQSSAQADATQRLNRIDLASNSSLRHLSLPGHDLVAIDLRANTSLDDTLDLSENPGPDGDRMTPDIVVPAPIFDQIPAENRMGVISDAEAPVQLSLTADVMSLPESGGAALLTAILNRTSTVSVTLTLVTDGTATLGVDYELSAMTLSIAAGESTAQATVTARDDMDMEGLETIVITATEVAGAQAGTIVVDLNLTDDDGVLPLVINEVLYDPPNDMPGDANGDGAREANEDEFVEIVNISASPVDLSGFMFFDTAALDMGMPRHTVPAGTMLGANQAYVLFGGGTPTGSFGGALVEAANGFEGRINLNNAGDVLTVQNSAGATILTFDVEPLSNNPNESYTRAPDLTGEFEQHNGVADGVLYSPGTRADGSNF